MPQTNEINIDVVKRIARALGDLNNRVVYVGGAVVSLYIDDPAADDVRPTQDIDISLEITSQGELENLRQELAKKQFTQSAADTVMCRFRYDGIPVDVMATEEIGWAPANRWFRPGFEHLQTLELESGLQIRILSVAYFLATKFEAYNDRGANDPRTSKDFEDIVYVLDNHTNLVNEIITAPADAKEFLIEQFNELLSDEMEEALLSHLTPLMQSERFELLQDKLKTIVDA
ncbi:MAG: nucleotidyl transferase AbiEii/AbiGii toxin family protein [Thiohalospira sp.]